MKYQFENCHLNVESHELYVDGVLRDVEPQVFDLLQLFVEHPGELISHDQLIEVVWGGRIVSDSALSARISAVNEAKPFIWKADPNKIIAARNRGFQTLESIH